MDHSNCLEIVEKWVEAKKNFSPFNHFAIRHPFVYEAWLGTSHGQFQAYWTKISDVSQSRSQAVELMNPSCMSQVTGGAELIQMVQYNSIGDVLAWHGDVHTILSSSGKCSQWSCECPHIFWGCSHWWRVCAHYYLGCPHMMCRCHLNIGLAIAFENWRWCRRVQWWSVNEHVRFVWDVPLHQSLHQDLWPLHHVCGPNSSTQTPWQAASNRDTRGMVGYNQGACRKKLSYTMLFFAFKASESLPPPAYFRNHYQIKQDPNHPSTLHFTPAIMKSVSNCLLSFVESHPLV